MMCGLRNVERITVNGKLMNEEYQTNVKGVRFCVHVRELKLILNDF